MSLTVVVPTANRPAYLKTCLQSISRQTAAARITRIIVSENSGCRDSEEICREFDHLNVTFRLNEPSLSIAAHFHRLLTEPDTEFTALLCDDDWWYPWHLEAAFKQLDARADLSAFCSQSVLYNEKMVLSDRQMPRVPIFLFHPNPDPTGVVYLSTKDLVPLSWFSTPFHCSTLVARTRALKAFSTELAAAHPYYLDRMLYPFLSLSGNMVYHVPETAGIRDHPANDVKTYVSEEVTKAKREGSDLIERLGIARGVDTVMEWQRVLAHADSQDRMLVQNNLLSFLSEKEIKDRGIWWLENPDKSDLFTYLTRSFSYWWHALQRAPKPSFYHPLKSAVRRSLRKLFPNKFRGE